MTTLSEQGHQLRYELVAHDTGQVSIFLSGVFIGGATGPEGLWHQLFDRPIKSPATEQKKLAPGLVPSPDEQEQFLLDQEQEMLDLIDLAMEED
jgi:hypothetical protein